MEEKTYEELLDLHKEITAKLEVLAEEDLENPDEIQEQINELQKRYLDLCKRKDDMGGKEEEGPISPSSSCRGCSSSKCSCT